MISTPTTFVVGAGASKDYGLPTSAELRQAANKVNPDYTAYQLILAAELCTTGQLDGILDDLRSQGTRSMDEFLFARQGSEITMKVGRALIALLLGSYFVEVRSPDVLGAESPDWLGYIINEMKSGAADVEAFEQGNTEVRFVTFNFDSIIEDRFEKAILNLYDAPEERLQGAVKSVHSQIIHVHGRLTPPPGELLPLDELDNLHKWIHWLRSAPSEIRVVMDQIERNTLDAAREAVTRSGILCFLGFAYAKDNLTKLGLPGAIKLGVAGDLGIYGTAFGMGKGEIVSVKNKLSGAELGDGSEHCREFLRDHQIFGD